jgi:hypothetical protein
MQFRDDPMGWNLVLLHLTTPFADDILKLPPRGLEGIADCYVNVFMSPGHSRLAAYNDVRSIGNNQVNPDVKDIALVMTVLRRPTTTRAQMIRLKNCSSLAASSRIRASMISEC